MYDLAIPEDRVQSLDQLKARLPDILTELQDRTQGNLAGVPPIKEDSVLLAATLVPILANAFLNAKKLHARASRKAGGRRPGTEDP